MRVLAIDSSTAIGSVAVVVDGELLAEVSARVRAKHGETLLPRVDAGLRSAGLAPADIELVAVGLGPGSFTGVRIGLATAKGIAFAAGVPIVGVCSLRVLARCIASQFHVSVPLVDAQRGEVYAAAYAMDEEERLTELLPPLHAAPEEVARQLASAVGERPMRVCGDGVRVYREALRRALAGPASGFSAPPVQEIPRASQLAVEAEQRFTQHGPDSLAALEPLYVRAPGVTLPRRGSKS